MSRTQHGSKGPGYEYWSRRFPYPLSPGRFAKALTVRRERRLGKQAVAKDSAALAVDSDPVGGRVETLNIEDSL